MIFLRRYFAACRCVDIVLARLFNELSSDLKTIKAFFHRHRLQRFVLQLLPSHYFPCAGIFCFTVFQLPYVFTEFSGLVFGWVVANNHKGTFSMLQFLSWGEGVLLYLQDHIIVLLVTNQIFYMYVRCLVSLSWANN